MPFFYVKFIKKQICLQKYDIIMFVMSYKMLVFTVVLGITTGYGAAAGHMKLAPAEFPKTINDVPFVQRMQNMAAGYAPFKDAKAFMSIKVGSEAEALQAQIEKEEARRELDALRMSPEEYCEKYPQDENRCKKETEPDNTENNDANGNSSNTTTSTTSTTSTTPTVNTPSVSGNGAANPPQQSSGKARAKCFSKNETGARRFIPPKVATERAYWWVGDSRFVGMYINKVIGHKDNEAVVAFGAQGHAWFTSKEPPTGISLLETCLRDGDVVILNLGANDIVKYDSYISTYRGLMSKYPNVVFKILSVNPVCDSKAILKNSNIETFNSHLKSAFPGSFIDTYSILKGRVNAQNTDSEGLHYRGGGIEQTIYDTVMKAVK